jgi:hypothetical protein
MKECDNSKIHISSNFLLSVCLLIQGLRSIPSECPRSISWPLTGPVAQLVQRTSVSVCIQTSVLYIECTYNSEVPRPQDIRWRTSYSDLLFNMKSHYGHLVRESLSTLYIVTKIFGIAGLLPKYTVRYRRLFCSENFSSYNVHNSNTTKSDTDKDSNFSLNNKTRMFWVMTNLMHSF